MNDEQKNQTTILPMSEMNIRRKCLEWTFELIKTDIVMHRVDFGFCGMQDLKCQIVDCAKALSDFLLEGKTAESIVGLTPLLMSASRLLKDRGITLSVASFNELMKVKGFMVVRPAMCVSLTKTRLEYGKDRPVGISPNPYYYDNKFDELLLLLGITEDKAKENTTKATKTKSK